MGQSAFHDSVCVCVCVGVRVQTVTYLPYMMNLRPGWLRRTVSPAAERAAGRQSKWQRWTWWHATVSTSCVACACTKGGGERHINQLLWGPPTTALHPLTWRDDRWQCNVPQWRRWWSAQSHWLRSRRARSPVCRCHRRRDSCRAARGCTDPVACLGTQREVVVRDSSLVLSHFAPTRAEQYQIRYGQVE